MSRVLLVLGLLRRVWLRMDAVVLPLWQFRRLRAVRPVLLLSRTTKQGRLRTTWGRHRRGTILAIELQRSHPEASGGMMGMMHTVKDSTEAPLLREEGVVTLGRATGRLRDRFLARQAVLLRGPPARITVREEAFVAIVVVGVGAVGDFVARPRLELLFLQLRQRILSILLLSFLHRRWRW